MKIIKAGFSKTFPTAAYFEKIFLEAEIIEGDNVRNVLYDLKKQIEQFHYESNKAADKQKEAQQPVSKNGDTFSLEEQINSCKEVKVLETYKLMVKGVPGLKKMYDKKLEELKISS